MSPPIKKRPNWTEADLFQLAKSFPNKQALKKGNKSLYLAILRHPRKDQICAHMKRPPVYNKKWTKESLLALCASYDNITDLRRDFPSAYGAIFKNGFQDELLSLMRRQTHFWSEEEIIAQCQAFTTRRQVKNLRSGVYKAVIQRGLQKQAFAHMLAHPNEKWTTANLLEECQKYPNRRELKIANPGAHQAVANHKLKDAAFAHMKKLTGESQAEIEIEQLILSLGLTTIRNHWIKIGPRRQLDLYIPSRNLAIEYCGLYWHNEDSPEPRLQTYHYDKMKLAESQGIRLITIFEDEWFNRPLQVQNFLSSVLGKSTNKIAARKCEIKEIDKVTGKSFLDTYHIQGPARLSVVWVGIFFQNELVGVISGGRHHRQGHRTTLVLDRLCFKSGTTVQGGASRLFKSLTTFARANHYTQILSWSDNRYSQGNVYQKLGFALDQELGPDYSYVKSGVLKRFSKQSLKKKGAERTGDLTEQELRKAQGFSRIWDCGKKRWIFNL